MKLIKFLMLSHVVCFFIAIAQVPRLGEPAGQVWSEAEEISLGRATYEHLLRNGKIYKHFADNDYLNYLGNTIASSVDTRLGLTFYLTRSKQINAFATPGGYIGVNVGLVLATDNEHELAGVLAHEIAHVAQSHIARSILDAKDRKIVNTAALLGAVLLANQTSGREGGAAIAAIMAGETQRQINTIRRHEREADREAAVLMEKAQFSALGLKSFFAKLYSPTGNSIPSYLLTHPLPQRRQAALDTVFVESKKLTSHDEYYLFKARLRSVFLSSGEINRIKHIDKKNKSIQIREANFYLTALELLKKGLFDESLQELVKITSSMQLNRDILLLKATLLVLKNDYDEAERSYQKLWEKFRGDSVVAYDYARFLTNQKKHQTAERLLKDFIDDSQNLQIYWLYGEILGKLGKALEQHSVLIKYYKCAGKYEQALNQTKIAQKKVQSDWKHRAIFDAEEKRIQHIIDKLKEL